jgi:hypothetical protein
MSSADPSDRDRLEALERMVQRLATLINTMADHLLTGHARLFALQSVLEHKGLVARTEIDDRTSRISKAADLAVELGPEYEEFRRIRRQTQERADDEGGMAREP